MDMDSLHLTGLVSTSKVARRAGLGEVGWREAQREGIFGYLWLIQLLYGRKEYNIVKQLYSNFEINYKTK